MKVFVVEDGEALRTLYRGIFERLGLETVEPPLESFDDVRLAFESNHKEIDIVVTDGNISRGFNGVDVVKLIRKIDPNLPIVVISDSEIIGDMMAAGGTVHISKPFEIPKLIPQVQELLNRKPDG